MEEQAGIQLTESLAMWPGAAVSGWDFSHPQSQYFVVGRLGRDQVASYAERKGLTLAAAELRTADRELAEQHYDEHREKPFFGELVDFLTRGPAVAMVVEGPEGYSLMPPGRYCRMSNVWFIPSAATLEGWLKRCGFRRIRCVDVSPTASSEQRRTEWMPFQSLQDGLDADDSSITIEGHPAPLRAIYVASN